MKGNNVLAMPKHAVDIVVDEIAAYGRVGVETGGFLLEPNNASHVAVVALAGTSGIVRMPLLLQMSARAIDRLFAFADDHGLSIPLQFHSHKAHAFLSPSDKLHGFRVDEFVSVVVPTFADPPREIERWSWFRFTAGDWSSISPAHLTAAPVKSVIFDEDGVRDA